MLYFNYLQNFIFSFGGMVFINNDTNYIGKTKVQNLRQLLKIPRSMK